MDDKPPRGSVNAFLTWQFRNAHVIVPRLIGVVVVGASLICIVTNAIDLGPAIRAAQGRGTPGTIVLTRVYCDERSCDWYGDFTSDDGSVTLRDAQMRDGPPDAQVGDRLRARHTGVSGPSWGFREAVYPETGSQGWIYVLSLLLLGVTVLVGWLILFPVRALRRRRRR